MTRALQPWNGRVPLSLNIDLAFFFLLLLLHFSQKGVMYHPSHFRELYWILTLTQFWAALSSVDIRKQCTSEGGRVCQKQHMQHLLHRPYWHRTNCLGFYSIWPLFFPTWFLILSAWASCPAVMDETWTIVLTWKIHEGKSMLGAYRWLAALRDGGRNLVLLRTWFLFYQNPKYQ